jgi:glyoxylase-like metal-dependent hydrolase (beta-lactamase superfamily II)
VARRRRDVRLGAEADLEQDQPTRRAQSHPPRDALPADRGEGRRILVDVGLGEKLTPKLRDIYRVEDAPTLEQSLAALGLGVADVTDVILTHLHFDHAGGSTRLDGDRLTPRCRARATTCSARTGRTPRTPIRASAPRTCPRTSSR